MFTIFQFFIHKIIIVIQLCWELYWSFITTTKNEKERENERNGIDERNNVYVLEMHSFEL